ncbi:Predicted esterase [Muriicola jejuensis]|uniref:Esterase n=1 Tax=Muriicola jejuensis TaxID=504488 RepID=A0A6P0UGZ4_9FLAO|nr:esterase [Muriicola jejuensis]NER11119.1 esterase [Muriicola jejuensis]SMP23830.1 Predicted esterase [Muriicola jejuensis]
MEVKEVAYPARNTVSTQNELTSKTTHVWILFHGMGYLSRYFLKYFDGLDPERHFLVAPQAPSKYYLDKHFKHVGASWLTKEDTELEIENILSYLDAMMAGLSLPKGIKLVVFGFSQGVSIATRWLARRKILCDHLILYAGGIPEEIKPSDVVHLNDHTGIKVIVGNRDEYISLERWELEKEKIQTLFKGRAVVEVFDGTHEIRKELINRLP